MIKSLFRNAYFIFAVLFLPSISQAQMYAIGDWSFIRDGGTACGLLSYTQDDISNMDAEELYAYARKIEKDTIFGTNTIFSLELQTKSRKTTTSLFSRLLNESPGAKRVIFIFDSGADIIELHGETPRRRIPSMIDELSHRNYVVIDISEFLKNAAPQFRKHNSVSIVVNGKKINSVSLKGFSSAFAKFQSC